MSEISVKITKAEMFAIQAHGDQKRKYTNEPYINHPMAVATLVDFINNSNEDMICASILHDVVEDTKYTLKDIEKRFGEKIAELVMWLTDISEPHHGNRAFRKQMDREHIAIAPADAQTIKLADLIDNTRSIVKHDPGFAKVYMQEKRKLLDVMDKGNKQLWLWADALVKDYYALNSQPKR